MQAVVYSLSLASLTLLAFLTLKHFDKRLTFACGVLCAAYIGLDDFATGMPSEFAGLRFADLIASDARWNWSGKTYSLLLSVAVISGLGLNAKAVGLTCVSPDCALMHGPCLRGIAGGTGVPPRPAVRRLAPDLESGPGGAIQRRS